MEKSLWSHISLVYRPIEVLFTLSIEAVFALSCLASEGLHTLIYVTRFGKIDHNVTIDISRNTSLKY